MKLLIKVSLFTIILLSCGDDSTKEGENLQDSPTVNAQNTYDVLMDENIIYGQGLSHEEYNSSESELVNLKLDVYYPDNAVENRPAFMFIHGGGFIGGSKQAVTIVNMANFFASRGWVFVSISYRLRDDLGTLPQEWFDFATESLPSEDNSQFLAMYPAIRDAKSAMRWLTANAVKYKVDTDFITVGGSSAGAITAIALGVSAEQDFRDEISIVQDPSLASTNLNQEFTIKTIVDFWGSKIALDALEAVYGHQRFDVNDPPLLIVHGTEDATVPFTSAISLKVIYEMNNIPLAYYPIQGAGHGVWNAVIDDKRLEDLVFDFVVEQQELNVE